MDIKAILEQRKWTLAPAFRQEIAIANGFNLQCCGLIATHESGASIVGSAADVDTDPEDRAAFELLERVFCWEVINGQGVYTALDWQGKPKRDMCRKLFLPSPDPKGWQYSKSNGVALRPSWDNACEVAIYEMIERDLVLASWLGFERPVQCEFHLSYLEGINSVYRYQVVHFGSRFVFGMPNPVQVFGVFLFPKRPNIPMIYGFSGHTVAEIAISKAAKEALQRLAFLWGEELPTNEMEFSPSPDYHQEHFLLKKNQLELQRWISGEFFNPNLGVRPATISIDFFDLTPSGENIPWRLVKASSVQAIPLAFGRVPFYPYSLLSGSRVIHPVA